MALSWSNRRAGAAATEDEEGRDVGPCPRVDYAIDLDVGDTEEVKAKGGGESLALFNYGQGNISVHFCRIFPYTLGRRISRHSSWGPSTAHSPPAEKVFFSDLSLFEGQVAGHLAIDKDYVGSATLLSPPLPLGDGKFLTLWITAAHNCISRKGRLYSIKINPQVYQSPKDWSEDLLARDESLTHDLEVVRCGSRDYVGLLDQEDHSPTKYGKADAFEKPTPDLAFCRVVTSDPIWPFSPNKSIRFSVPNPHMLHSGDQIVKLGYPGHVSKSTFIRKYKSALPSLSKLEAEFSKLDGYILRPQTFSASPSEVYLVGAESRVVKDKGSSWPGMSGGPTLNLKKPYLLDGVHIGAFYARKFNHFLSVHHPFFTCGYAELMGPFLATIQWPTAEMEEAVKAYLHLHESFLKKASLWSEEVAIYVTGGSNMPGLLSVKKRKRDVQAQAALC